MALDDPLIGKKLGDYTIQSLLGRGGMSRVYKGYDANLDRYAAVKVISGDFVTTSEEEYTRRFQTEARAIARLRHENIVGVYQFGRTEGIYYMAQVFLEGQDLRSLMKSYASHGERMPKEEVLRIVRDITRALDYAHEQGVIHRDIKPSNIMLEKRSGRAILMDFGLALSVNEGTMGDTFGSAHYIAPEQAISSAKAVPQSDLYSLGIVIYEMLTGKVPFDDPSVMSVALKHLNELPPPPSMYNPRLPSAVESVILRLLDKEPTRRYATGWQLFNALNEAFEQAQVESDFDDLPMGDLFPSQPLIESTSSRPQLPPILPIGESGGVAGRFARHRERKETEAAIETGNGLKIDEATLNSILDGYADPRDLDLRDTASLPRSAAMNAYKASRSRRAKIGTLLFSSLLLAIMVGIAWLALGLNNHSDSGANSADETLMAAVALELTATADAEIILSAEPPTATTVTVVSAPTDTSGTVVADAPTDAPTDIPTEPPTATATEPPTATDEPTPTETPTEAPTDAPTEAPTEAANVPVSTATTAPVVSGGENAPNVRLQYTQESTGQGQFLLINLSGDTLDVSGLIFERERRDGTLLQYQARLWDRAGISASPEAMPGFSCFQLVTTNGTYRTSSGGNCPLFLGYYRTNIPERYFWLPQEPDSVFTVRDEVTATTLATCSLDAEVCEFYITPSDTSASSESLPTPAALTQIEGADLHLKYDVDSFLIINVSDRRLDISGLTFEQQLSDGAYRRFDATQWDRSDMLEPPSAFIAGGCYQLVSADGTQHAPSTSDCEHFLGWFRTSLTRRYFWLADRPGATFAIKLTGTDTYLATCDIDAGECFVALPKN